MNSKFVYKVLTDAIIVVNHSDNDTFRRWYPRMKDETEAEYCQREINFCKRNLETMVDQIKRHVDCVSYAGLHITTGTLCAFCHREYEEDQDGEPLCCTEALNAKLGM